MRVAAFPKLSDMSSNPYWRLLETNLETLGIQFETSHNSYWMARKWLWRHRNQVNVLHFHFVQPQYAGARRIVVVRRLAKFASDLALAKLLGYRIIWTMHDLMPMWPLEPVWLDRIGRYIIAGLADGVIVHCQEARRLLAQHFHRRRSVWVARHPAFVGAYPAYLSRQAARDRLEIDPDVRMMLFVGGIHPAKGLETLVQAFGQLADDNLVLWIVGKVWPPESYAQELRTLATRDRRVRLVESFVPDDEMQLYVKAADVVVLPFARGLTSGSTVLAMSFGRPVIAPAMGCLPETVVPGAGFLYQPGDVNSLHEALVRCLAADLEEMGRQALVEVQQHTWQVMAMQTLRAYGLSEQEILRHAQWPSTEANR